VGDSVGRGRTKKKSPVWIKSVGEKRRKRFRVASLQRCGGCLVKKHKKDQRGHEGGGGWEVN